LTADDCRRDVDRARAARARDDADDAEGLRLTRVDLRDRMNVVHASDVKASPTLTVPDVTVIASA
jgi:hypothetical protein